MPSPKAIIATLLLGLLFCTPAIAQTDTSDQKQSDEQSDEEFKPILDWGEKKVERKRPQQPAQQSRNNQDTSEQTVSFGAFSTPLELTTLIDYVGSALNINIVVKGAPSGSIVFNAPVSVPKSKLIDLLDAMLEQYAFTISHEPISNFWIVQPISDARPTMSTERSSTQIIPTPNIKPSLIKPALDAALGGSAPRAGVKAGGGGAIQAIDELGVLIINAPPRDIERVKALVAELIKIDDNQQFIRFELKHLAAPVALQRAIGLAGGSSQGSPRLPTNPNTAGGAGLSSSSFSNMADRITVDPQGNALIFKGTEEEIARVQEVLDVIDVPNTLEPKNYFAGSSAAQIADIAKNRGLGEVISISNNNQSQNPFARSTFRGNNQPGIQSQQASTTTGGPVMVVDTNRGNIIYYGTPAQQKQLADLMEELNTEDERVVIKEYILNHSDAEIVAELMTAIITGQQQTGNSDFLPGSSGGRNTIRSEFQQFFGQSGGGSDVTAAFDPNVVSVIADPDNNQVIVRAPIKQQDDLAKLISRLDRRKAQVFLQAMIVSVSDTENFTLAFESQISAGQFGLNTGNTLSGVPTGGVFGDQQAVNPGLGGLTAAVIMTNQIPIIINASQTNSDIRILSTPQLLVNDNQESEIVSLSEQPYSEVSQANTGGSNLVGFGGFAEAGTTLRVTPSISDGGFLRLEYFIELSNFTAATGTDGSPPPRDRNTIQGTATIPSDATIVIGGISVDNVRDTVIKVPFLGDIPIVGELFKNTSKINTKSKLYVFLTPRIMTDPNFLDLRLLSEGPYAQMDLDPLVPKLQSITIGATTKPANTTLPPPPSPESNTPQLMPVLINPNAIDRETE